MAFKVGDRILCRAGIAGATGPIDTGALPILWDCPTGQAITDSVKYPQGISTDGTMVFIAIKSGKDVNLRFLSVVNQTSHVGALIDIDPLPPVTGQGVIVEGLAP